MSDVEEPGLRPLEVSERFFHFTTDVAEYLTELAYYLDIFEGEDPTAEPCDDLCGNRVCDNCGCIKYRIRTANILLQAQRACEQAAPKSSEVTDARLREILAEAWAVEWPGSTGIYDMRSAAEDYYADVPIRFILSAMRRAVEAAQASLRDAAPRPTDMTEDGRAGPSALEEEAGNGRGLR